MLKLGLSVPQLTVFGRRERNDFAPDLSPLHKKVHDRPADVLIVGIEAQMTARARAWDAG